jgi:Fe-S-cluster containining protein
MKYRGEGKSHMIDRLTQIYQLYDRITGSTALACRPGCAGCCTCNVTLTSLEARLMFNRLSSSRRRTLYAAITQKFPQNRYIPKTSTNRFAGLCMEDADLPEEENDPAWGQCPLLENDRCTIYDVRPFGCRAMVSETDCRDTGSAQMPAWILTVNNLFLQAIEHLDQDGYSGNLSDMLHRALSGNDVTGQDIQNHDLKNHKLFVKNEPITCLMIPPEHREQMAPIVRDLSELINTGLERNQGQGQGNDR